PPPNNPSSETLTLDDTPDPALTNTAGCFTAAPRRPVTYTITLRNAGSQDATKVSRSDPLPANTSFSSASNGGALSGGSVVWSIGNLAAGASVTRTVTISVSPTVGAGITQLSNTATAQDDGANGADPTPAD